MSQKLGNYIHWKYSNYKRFGTSTSSGETPPSASKLVDDLKKSVIKNIKSKNLTPTDMLYLQNALNFFYGQNKNIQKIQITEQQREKLLQALLKQMESEGKRLNGLVVDTNNLSAIKVKTSAQGQNNSTRIRNNIIGSQHTYADAIYRRIQELKRRTDMGVIGGDLATRIDNFFNSYNSLCLQVENILTAQAAANNVQISELKNVRLGSTWIKQNSNFIDELNKLIDLTSLSTDIEITGLLGEYASAVMPEAYEAAIQGTLDEFIEKHLVKTLKENYVGSERSAKVIMDDLVYGGAHGQRKNKSGSLTSWSTIGKYGQKVDFTYTQNKADIMLSLSNNKKVLGSVKNYFEGANSIHLLKGSSLIKYLQLYPDFGNHYLNITANKGRQPNERAPRSEVTKIHRGMLIALGAHALAGGLYGVAPNSKTVQKYKGADILIINKRSKAGGQFIVYDIGSLINNIEKALEFSGGLDLNTPQEWSNKFLHTPTMRLKSGPQRFRTAYARCINILSELHAVQLNVSLKTSHLPTK